MKFTQHKRWTYDLSLGWAKRIKEHPMRIGFLKYFLFFGLIMFSYSAFAENTSKSVKVIKSDNIKVDTIKSANTIVIKSGNKNLASVGVDSVSKSKMIINVMGKSASVDIDTAEISIDTLNAMIDTLGGQVFTTSVVTSGDEEHEFDFLKSIFSSTKTIIFFIIISIFVILLFLGVPILIFVLILQKMKFVHTERVKALEQGIILNGGISNESSTSEKDYLRKGLILSLIGLGSAIAIPFLGKFMGFLAVIFGFWGVGLLLWLVVINKKNSSFKFRNNKSTDISTENNTVNQEDNQNK